MGGSSNFKFQMVLPGQMARAIVCRLSVLSFSSSRRARLAQRAALLEILLLIQPNEHHGKGLLSLADGEKNGLLHQPFVEGNSTKAALVVGQDVLAKLQVPSKDRTLMQCAIIMSWRDETCTEMCSKTSLTHVSKQKGRRM